MKHDDYFSLTMNSTKNKSSAPADYCEVLVHLSAADATISMAKGGFEIRGFEQLCYGSTLDLPH